MNCRRPISGWQVEATPLRTLCRVQYRSGGGGGLQGALKSAGTHRELSQESHCLQAGRLELDSWLGWILHHYHCVQDRQPIQHPTMRQEPGTPSWEVTNRNVKIGTLMQRNILHAGIFPRR
jgi:hypothetical protein